MQGLRAFRRYFDFSGRSGRAEYWQFLALFAGALLVVFILDVLVGNATTPVLTVLTGLALIIPTYSVGFRRAHDRGMSGWWVGASGGLALLRLLMIYQAGQLLYGSVSDILISLSRLLGYAVFGLQAYLIYECVRRGVAITNRYGAPPSDADGPAPTVSELIDRYKELGRSVMAAPPVAPSHAADPLGQIARLAELRDAGALTEAEFTERKAALLSRL